MLQIHACLSSLRTAPLVRYPILVALSLWLSLSSFGHAEPTTPKTSGASTSASTTSAANPLDEAALKAVLESKLGAAVDGISKLGISGLYEVRIGNDIVYTDTNAQHLFVGSIIDMNTRANLTRERTQALVEASSPKIAFNDFPLASAIKIVKGNGKRQAVIFEDPNCHFCKQLEKSLTEVTDTTLYVFLYPILGDDSADKSKAIWCSSDRAKIWTSWMTVAASIPALAANTSCVTPIEKNVALGKKLHVDGTPTIFFANGKRRAGSLPADEMNKLLAESSGN